MAAPPSPQRRRLSTISLVSTSTSQPEIPPIPDEGAPRDPLPPLPTDTELITVHLADGTFKRLSVTYGTTVRQLCDEVTHRLGLRHPELFSLALSDRSEGWLLEPCPVLPLLLRLSVPRPWACAFKAKYIVPGMARLLSDDTAAAQLVFLQLCSAVMAEDLPCTAEQAAKLAAYQVQQAFGDHVPARHRSGFLDSVGERQFIPPRFVQAGLAGKVQADVFEEHARLRGMSAHHARLAYIDYARLLPGYGIAIFTASDGEGPVYMGVGWEGICVFDKEAKRFPYFFVFSDLVEWRAEGPAVLVKTSTTGPLWARFDVTGEHTALCVCDMLDGYSRLRATLWHSIGPSIAGSMLEDSPPCSARDSVSSNSSSSSSNIGGDLIVGCYLLDGTKKSYHIDEGMAVEVLFHKFADHVELRQRELFGLQAVDPQAGAECWLSFGTTVAEYFGGEHGLEPGRTRLYLKQRYFPKDFVAGLTDAKAVYLSYLQVKQAVVEGHYACTAEQAIVLAAASLQERFGNYDKVKQPPGFLDMLGLHNFLPRRCTRWGFTAHWEYFIRKIQGEGMRGMTPNDARRHFLQLACMLPTFRVTKAFVRVVGAFV